MFTSYKPTVEYEQERGMEDDNMIGKGRDTSRSLERP